MIKSILNKIEEFNTIVIHRHNRPDGDAYSSQLGLKMFIELNYPNKKVYAVGDKTKYLSDIVQVDEIEDSIYDDALVFVVDTGSQDRIADERFDKGKFLIKIDHHINVESFGDLEWVDTSYPACALMISDIVFSKEDYIINQNLAEMLYYGIVTDTGRFKYPSINGKALRLAAKLIEVGIDLEKVNGVLYLRDKDEFKLKGYTMLNHEYTKNGVAYITFSMKLMKELGVNDEEAASMVNVMDSIIGSQIWILFIEHESNLYRARIRSRYIPINELANKYNGGGHKNASGATLGDEKNIKKLLKDADKILKEFKKENPGLN